MFMAKSDLGSDSQIPSLVNFLIPMPLTLIVLYLLARSEPY